MTKKRSINHKRYPRTKPPTLTAPLNKRPQWVSAARRNPNQPPKHLPTLNPLPHMGESKSNSNNRWQVRRQLVAVTWTCVRTMPRRSWFRRLWRSTRSVSKWRVKGRTTRTNSSKPRSPSRSETPKKLEKSQSTQWQGETRLVNGPANDASTSLRRCSAVSTTDGRAATSLPSPRRPESASTCIRWRCRTTRMTSSWKNGAFSSRSSSARFPTSTIFSRAENSRFSAGALARWQVSWTRWSLRGRLRSWRSIALISASMRIRRLVRCSSTRKRTLPFRPFWIERSCNFRYVLCLVISHLVRCLFILFNLSLCDLQKQVDQFNKFSICYD